MSSENSELTSLRAKEFANVFRRLLSGDVVHPMELVHSLVESSCAHIPHGLAMAIRDYVHDGKNIRPTFYCEFHYIMQLTAICSFGTAEPHALPSWFLKTNGLLIYGAVSYIHGWLSTACFHPSPLHQNTCKNIARKTWSVLVDLAAAMHPCISNPGFDTKQPDTGILTLLHEMTEGDAGKRRNFLNAGIETHSPYVPMTSADVTFAEFVAERILATPSRDVDGWCTAFGFYAGSRQWRGYVRRCVKYSDFGTPTAQRLADAVVKAFHSVPRLDEEEDKEDMLSLKRARSDPTSEQSLRYESLQFGSGDRPSSSHDPISNLAYKVVDDLGADRRPEELLQRIEEEAKSVTRPCTPPPRSGDATPRSSPDRPDETRRVLPKSSYSNFESHTRLISRRESRLGGRPTSLGAFGTDAREDARKHARRRIELLRSASESED